MDSRYVDEDIRQEARRRLATDADFLATVLTAMRIADVPQDQAEIAQMACACALLVSREWMAPA